MLNLTYLQRRMGLNVATWVVVPTRVQGAEEDWEGK